MKTDFNVIIEKDEEGFYIASVPALSGCHTQAKSLDILMERIKEAIELCIEDEEFIYPYDFVGVQKISVNEKNIKYSDNKHK
ncbi:MAG: type II toxin-antitoxin system HicB family antitoxin [Ignavibacteriales bacterium]|nr:type II toxin-antitoxin system HicB family antitoxin [Ignavibacteriales bacterium]